MDELRRTFGRPLRLAMIGGGPRSWIGRMHHGAATHDGWWTVTGGVFSGDPGRSRQAGVELGFAAERCHGTVRELIDAERQRADGIDAVAIMTPNDTHYEYAAAALDAGLDVIADKPVSNTWSEACDLMARATRGGRLFAIMHGYSGYPMTRYARRLVQDGTLGPLRFVQVEYIQGGMATRLEDGPLDNRLKWVLDPKRGGLALVLSAIGCHAQHLACFGADRSLARVCADVATVVPGRQVVDYVSALLEFNGGVRGTFTATQAAAGGENDIRLRLYGERGMTDWSHREPSYLRVAMQGEPARIVGRGDAYLPPEIIAGGRAPRGHPEGMLEAFANIYNDVARRRMAIALGEPLPTLVYPSIEDGVHTMAFIEACLSSHERGGWALIAPAPAAASTPR
jgi:predicted dehydrogenase